MILALGADVQFVYMDELGYWGAQIEQKGELIVFGTRMNSLCFAWVGIFLILTGSLFINPLWENRFREASFVECEGSVLNVRNILVMMGSSWLPNI